MGNIIPLFNKKCIDNGVCVLYNIGMDIVRHIYISEYHNRITLAIKDDDGSTSVVKYEDGTDFNEKIVDLFLDILTYRIRVAKNVSPFLNSITCCDDKESRRTMDLLKRAYGLDQPFSVYSTKQEQARRDKAMCELRERLYSLYVAHAEGLNGPRFY